MGLFHKACAGEFDSAHRKRKHQAEKPSEPGLVDALRAAKVATLRDVIDQLRSFGLDNSAIQTFAASCHTAISGMLGIDNVPARVGRLLKAAS